MYLKIGVWTHKYSAEQLKLSEMLSNRPLVGEAHRAVGVKEVPFRRSSAEKPSFGKAFEPPPRGDPENEWKTTQPNLQQCASSILGTPRVTFDLGATPTKWNLSSAGRRGKGGHGARAGCRAGAVA